MINLSFVGVFVASDGPNISSLGLLGVLTYLPSYMVAVAAMID